MSTAQLAGNLHFRPGRRDAIRGTRRPLANRLLRGRSADEAPERLRALYSLCGESHRITARLAIDAARGSGVGANADEHARIARETLREHVMRMWVDWPRLLGGENDTAGLRDCPVFKDGIAIEATAQWVRDAVLGGDIDAWLAAWTADPESLLAAWTERGATLPARLLKGVSEMARSLAARSQPLWPHGSRTTMEALAETLAAEPDFETFPVWQGRCCETGTWNRLAMAGRHRDEVGHRAWFRLGARVAEAALLARGTPAVLSIGAVPVAPGHAIAWCEMARGLLVHRVHLVQKEAQDIIADYRIVAPTEWNFHPGGAAAEMIAGLPAGDDSPARQSTISKVNIVAAAFDPCVAFEVETGYA